MFNRFDYPVNNMFIHNLFLLTVKLSVLVKEEWSYHSSTLFLS